MLIPGTDLLNDYFLAFVYGLTLVYLFLGIAIVSDIFMASIEEITSQTKSIKYFDFEKEEYKTISKHVWNPTVANLTLMALGSSAPEILLSVIETIMTLGSKPGELGPSTIVGSAAFNLLIITAVSIMSVPTGSIKKIVDVGVFVVTTVASLFAYIWMYIVLQVWTPSVITIEEGALTFLYFFLLIGLAYGADKYNAIKNLKKAGETETK